MGEKKLLDATVRSGAEQAASRRPGLNNWERRLGTRCSVSSRSPGTSLFTDVDAVVSAGALGSVRRGGLLSVGQHFQRFHLLF